MIPAWMISLLCTDGVEEFSFTYNEEQKISIDGKKFGGEWIVSFYVIAMPHFACGANKFNTHITGSYKDVVRWYVTDTLNKLSLYKGAKGREKLLALLRSDLGKP